MAMRFPASAELAAVERVGTGGGGEVWSANHPELGTVAVKIAHENTPAARHSFTTEYTLLRSLKHTAVVSLFDFGCMEDGRPFIVMELCQGGDLYQASDKLPLEHRLRLFAQTLTGFEYLHNVGLIHRDIKGENVLIAQDGTPRISDLGLAISSGSADRDRSGTLEYMAPEIMRNEGATIASDIYSLGVTLYRLVTGKLPFAGTDPLKVVAAKQDLESIDWDDIESLISARTVEFLRKALHPNVEERISTARSFIDHLLGERLVDPQVIESPDIRNYVHHHFRSFNFSFCMQEFKEMEGDLFIADNLQDPESGLFECITDYLKTSFCHVEIDHQNRLIRFSTESDTGGSIQLQQRLNQSAASAKLIEYPEITHDSLMRLSSKILRRDLLPRYQSLIQDYTAGNLALLSLLLVSLQHQGYLDIRKLRLGLPPDEIDRFTPDDEYWDKLATLMPEVDHNIVPVAAFLACDNSGYPVENLVSSRLVSQADLAALTQAGILSDKQQRFVRSYMRLYFHHALDLNERRQFHAEWIAHLQASDQGDDDSKIRYLYEHYVAAMLPEEAIAASIKFAQLHSANQDFEEAYEVLSRVRRLATESSPTEPVLWYFIHLAAAAKKLGKVDEALRIFSFVIRNANRLNDTAILAEAYKRVGDSYKDKRQFARGLRALAKATEYYEKAGNELELSHCFNNIGNLHWIAGDLKGAAQDYHRALEIQRRLNVRRDIASTLSNLGTVMAVQQDLEPAIELYEESIAIKRELNDRLELARSLNNLARASLDADRIAKAREYLKEALEINLDLGAENELPYNYDNLYELEYRGGHYKRALNWLTTGLRRSNKNDVSSRATFVCYLAELMLATGNYGKAAKYLNTVAPLEQQVTDHILSARLSAAFCDFARVVRDFATARAWIDKAMEDAKKLGDSKAMAQVHIKSARIALAEGDSGGTVESELTKAARLIADLPARRELMMIRLAQLQWHLEQDQLQDAALIIAELEQSRSMEIFKPFEPECLYSKAWLAFSNGDINLAAEYAIESAESARALGIKEIEWQALLIAGEAFRELRKYEKAMSAYIGAFETIQMLARSISDEHLRELFVEDDNKLIVADRLREMRELVS